jgi:phage N-6-adenine-methyltransferase
MSSESLYQRGNDEYATPEWIREGLFSRWYDPCPLSNGLVDRDGLNSSWSADRVFLNPPYSNPLPWVEKAIVESRKGKTIVLLVKHDTSTIWWAKLHEAGAHFLPIIGRLQFAVAHGRRRGRKAAAPFPSVLAVLYSECIERRKNE